MCLCLCVCVCVCVCVAVERSSGYGRGKRGSTLSLNVLLVAQHRFPEASSPTPVPGRKAACLLLLLPVPPAPWVPPLLAVVLVARALSLSLSLQSRLRPLAILLTVHACAPHPAADSGTMPLLLSRFCRMPGAEHQQLRTPKGCSSARRPLPWREDGKSRVSWPGAAGSFTAPRGLFAPTLLLYRPLARATLPK